MTYLHRYLSSCWVKNLKTVGVITEYNVDFILHLRDSKKKIAHDETSEWRYKNTNVSTENLRLMS